MRHIPDTGTTDSNTIYIFTCKFDASYDLFSAVLPENLVGGLLLTENFYRHCVDAFSVPLKNVGMQTGTFHKKHLNIIDPLNDFNNLGRSVSEGRTHSLSLNPILADAYVVFN